MNSHFYFIHRTLIYIPCILQHNMATSANKQAIMVAYNEVMADKINVEL